MTEGRQTLSSTLTSQSYTGGAMERGGTFSEGNPSWDWQALGEKGRDGGLHIEGSGLLDQGIFQVPAS